MVGMRYTHSIRRVTLGILVAGFIVLFLGMCISSAGADLTVSQCLGCHPEIQAEYYQGSWWSTLWHPDIVCATSGCHWPGGPYPEEGWWWNDYLTPWEMSDHHYDPCTYCHSVEFPAVAQHTSESIAASHTRTNQLCRGCHSDSLVVEHDGCVICHASTAPRVVTAIAAGDISCEACHTYEKGHGAGTKSGGEGPSR